MDLDFIDDEIFAEHREVRGQSDGLKVVVIAAEMHRLAQNGNASGVAGICACNSAGLVVLADQPQGGRGGLALHDEGIGGAVEAVIERASGAG